MNLTKIKDNFRKNTEKKKNKGDEANINFNASKYIVTPLFNHYSPHSDLKYDSEHHYSTGGSSDGTIGSLIFEYKKSYYFDYKEGLKEALYGRKNDKGVRIGGLFHYIIESTFDDVSYIKDTVFKKSGIGFDGNKWIFARFIPSNHITKIKMPGSKLNGKELRAQFVSRVVDFEEGLHTLVELIRSADKLTLSKDNLTSIFSPMNVKKDVLSLYNIISRETDIKSEDFNNRAKILYDEWLRNFGAMFGNDDENSEFNDTAQYISRLYDIPYKNMNSKIFLFSLQTYFNIFLKLLVSDFLEQAKAPSFSLPTYMNYKGIVDLFTGVGKINGINIDFINNFFELHYFEWFVFTSNKDYINRIVHIVNNILVQLEQFDMGTFLVRPENVHDILQEVYMNLIPDKVRHLLGEYFSPDWITEFSLNHLGYSYENFGDSLINKKIIDPTCGSGTFLLQALKRVSLSNTLYSNNDKKFLTKDELNKITSNIVGFDLNPISAIAAKANYILTLIPFINLRENMKNNDMHLTIPIFIADSVLSPIVYSKENKSVFVANTSIGNFNIPKFNNFNIANSFMNDLSSFINSYEKPNDNLMLNNDIEKKRKENIEKNFNVFWNEVNTQYHLSSNIRKTSFNLYLKLAKLHRQQKDSFWPSIIKNSFAPVLLKNKFDFVVGNPPWIAWKAMSKTYRDGTLKVWKSYGIFEKNAYDKKTTHDDFGMAVTYVALDQYLRQNGKLMFLLPKTFIKSAKGGQGFRKFRITRKGQNIPIKILEVNDFNNIKIFIPKHTVSTISVLMQKGYYNHFPMRKWYSWNYNGNKRLTFGAHDKWINVKNKINSRTLSAKPVNSSDTQSPWLTLPEKELNMSNKILSNGNKQYYKGRKGVEPAGAKGVYVLKKPIVNQNNSNYLNIINDMSRQRRKDIKDKGAHKGTIESKYVFPMIGGRNIQRWRVLSSEYMVVPHDSNHVYGLSEEELAKYAPKTFKWLLFYHDELLATRIQNGKYFNKKINPWYRLDNIGKYSYSKYKVVWKEQSKNFSAVAIGTYKQSIPRADTSLFEGTKPIMNDSKTLSISTDTFDEALFITGILNSPTVRAIIDAYAVQLNRGTDVIKYINVPKFDSQNNDHVRISNIAKDIQNSINDLNKDSLNYKEKLLDKAVNKLFIN